MPCDDEMRVELLALNQCLFTALIADNHAFAEETLVTPLLLNQKSHLVLDC